LAVLGRLLADAVSALDRDRESTRLTLSRAVALLEAEHAATDGSREGAVGAGGLAPWQAKRVTRYVDDRLEGGISIADLAGQARLSKSYFCRSFRATFGLSPQKYIAERRVTRSQEIMLTTDEPLSQVAGICGFSDQAHFSRIFRQATGQSPSAWRRARRSQVAPAGGWRASAA
jgi:AraC-like DNA-binding protein